MLGYYYIYNLIEPIFFNLIGPLLVYITLRLIIWRVVVHDLFWDVTLYKYNMNVI